MYDLVKSSQQGSDGPARVQSPTGAVKGCASVGATGAGWSRAIKPDQTKSNQSPAASGSAPICGLKLKIKDLHIST